MTTTKGFRATSSDEVSNDVHFTHCERPSRIMQGHGSKSIPLPKSHIRRTPSELEIADNLLVAERHDVRMYSRLLTGMQSQCVAAGYVHPLNQKSLQGIVRTKHVDYEQSENKDDCVEHDWSTSHEYTDDADSWDNTMQGYVPHSGASLQPSLSATTSDCSMSTLSYSGDDSLCDDEDDFFFSLDP